MSDVVDLKVALDILYKCMVPMEDDDHDEFDMV
jgi:hypothetical protein